MSFPVIRSVCALSLLLGGCKTADTKGATGSDEAAEQSDEARSDRNEPSDDERPTVDKYVHDPDEAPEPEYKIEANYGDKLELVGFTVGDPDDDDPLVAGQEVTIRWYWRALQDLDEDWKIFVHLDSNNKDVPVAQRRQNLDHAAVSGRLPTSEWPEGKVVEDLQNVVLKEDYPAGPTTPYVGFYRGRTRLPLSNDVPKTDDRRLRGPRLEVVRRDGSENEDSKSANEQTTLPRYELTSISESANAITIDGKLDETVWSSRETLTLKRFGGDTRKETTVRAFVADGYLYVGAELEDDHVWSKKEERDSEIWTEEAFDTFVDVDGDGSNYLELQINPLGAVFDARFEQRLGTGERSRRDQIDRASEFDVEGLESAVQVDGTVNEPDDEDGGWTVEYRIPVESLPGVENAADAPTEWAVNFYRYDRPESDEMNAYGWSTAPRTDFHRVEKFGRFMLENGAAE